MLSKQEIENKLNQVAKHELGLWDFHVWLEDASWNMHKDSSESTMALVQDIKLAFEEYYQSRKDESELYECLMGIPVIYIRPVTESVSFQVSPYLVTPASQPQGLLFA